MFNKLYISLFSFLFLILIAFFNVGNIYSQEHNFPRAYQDFLYTRDQYNSSLSNFNQKKVSYQKNPTLSLKEELRLALFDFLIQRNDFVKTYLTTLRLRVDSSPVISAANKQTIFAKIDTNVGWYNEHRKAFGQTDLLETLLGKSKEEDSYFETETSVNSDYALLSIALSDVVRLRTEHELVYNKLKTETESLISLGRANRTLFTRWYTDIDNELNMVKDSEAKAIDILNRVGYSKQEHTRTRLVAEAYETLTAGRGSLLKMNSFMGEFENVVNTKR